MEETSKPLPGPAAARYSLLCCPRGRLHLRLRTLKKKVFVDSLAFYRHCNRITASQTKSSNTAVNVAPHHFINQGYQDAGSAGSDGMSDGDRTAIHVDLNGIETKLSNYPQGLYGEGFVEFVEIDIFILPAGFLPNFPYRADRSHHDPGGIDTAASLSNDAGHWFCAEFFCTLRARYDHRGSTIVDSRSVTGGHCAIFLERGLQGTQNLDCGVFSGRFILIEDHGRLALFLGRQFNRNNLRLKTAFFDGSHRFAMRVQRELILLLAGN